MSHLSLGFMYHYLIYRMSQCNMCFLQSAWPRAWAAALSAAQQDLLTLPPPPGRGVPGRARLRPEDASQAGRAAGGRPAPAHAHPRTRVQVLPPAQAAGARPPRPAWPRSSSPLRFCSDLEPAGFGVRRSGPAPCPRSPVAQVAPCGPLRAPGSATPLQAACGAPRLPRRGPDPPWPGRAAALPRRRPLRGPAAEGRPGGPPVPRAIS